MNRPFLQVRWADGYIEEFPLANGSFWRLDPDRGVLIVKHYLAGDEPVQESRDEIPLCNVRFYTVYPRL